jgi:ribosome-associated protein
MIRITPAISIAESELKEAFLRASGPGGQNVNKLETAVQLRFAAMASPNLPDAVKQRLVALAGRRMTQDGVLIITAERHRMREANREEARQKLVLPCARQRYRLRHRARRPNQPPVQKQGALNRKHAAARSSGCVAGRLRIDGGKSA